jgi:hypothetical protein
MHDLNANAHVNVTANTILGRAVRGPGLVRAAVDFGGVHKA